VTVRRILSGLALLLALALLPDAAAACPVCFDPREENRMAFLATTVFLSLLPLGMVAGAGLWVRRRVREMDDEGPGEEDGWHRPGAGRDA
jgi:hypothetical protein